MPLTKEQQQEYDSLVENYRSTVRSILEIGADDPEATADDLRSLLDDLIGEQGEN